MAPYAMELRDAVGLDFGSDATDEIGGGADESLQATDESQGWNLTGCGVKPRG